MNPELEAIARKIGQAENPEDLFGSLEGVEDREEQGHSIYRNLSTLAHPNAYRDGEEIRLAEEAFKKLSALWEIARTKLRNGTYGIIDETETREPVTIHRGGREYVVLNQIEAGDFCNFYKCKYTKDDIEGDCIFKIARDPAYNEFVENEARILKILSGAEEYDKFGPYIPELIDSFSFSDALDPAPRQVNILNSTEGFYSLKEVREAFPKGVDPKDMAWMFRRLLVGLGFAHINNATHGAILPTNVLIHPELHGLIISEWSYAIHEPQVTGERINSVSTTYENWYPQEVFRKEIPTSALDIYMAAENMIYILGGEPTTGTFPDEINPRIRSFIRGSMLPSPMQRPKDAWRLLDEFDELIESLWGPRRFHQFSMPNKAERG